MLTAITLEVNFMLDAALRYAEMKWHVIPLHHIERGQCSCNRHKCTSPGKHPRTRHGLKDGTTNKSKIRGWWKQWPNANIGIVTGEISGFFALDIDPDKGGNESLTELTDSYGRLPDTLSQTTGGNGKHYLFALPNNEIKGSISKVGRGIDIRANGNYILVPPSNHISGEQYLWNSDFVDTPILSAPEWLLHIIKYPPLELPIVTDKQNTNGKTHEGERNNYLASLAGKLRHEGKTKGQITITLLEENRLNCIPPLDDKEVQRIADSIGAYRKGSKPKYIKYQYLDWVRAPDSPVPAPTNHILTDLTCWMDKDGRQCFPTIKDLALTTKLNEKTVRKHLTKADKNKWIGRYKRQIPGQAWPNYGYFIPPDLLKKTKA
jgi:hypothetical protein